MTAIARRDAEAPTAVTAGASRDGVQNTPDRIMDARSMSTNASSPLSPAEAARLARGLTALQNWLLRRIVAAGGAWNSLESPFSELDGGGQAVAALKRKGLIRTTAFHKILTPAGAQVAALLAANVISAGSLDNWSAWLLYIAEHLDEHFADAAEAALRETRDAIDRRLETGAW